jgi:predicted HAD superfamily hydrolase
MKLLNSSQKHDEVIDCIYLDLAIILSDANDKGWGSRKIYKKTYVLLEMYENNNYITKFADIVANKSFIIVKVYLPRLRKLEVKL